MKKADSQKKTKSPSASKTVKRSKAKPRGSALEAAAEVLKRTGKVMKCKEMIVAMSERGLWQSPGGKTPHATLRAAILKEIKMKGRTARFKKVDRGQFAFNG